MAYTLGDKCAKNLCKRTVLVQFIMKMCSHFFETQRIITQIVYVRYCYQQL